MEKTTKKIYRYNRTELTMMQNGYTFDKDFQLVKNPNVKTPVRVLNPFTDRMILLSTLYQLQDYRDEKIYYDIDTNTIGVSDEKLKEKLNDKFEKEKKIAERVRKINEIFGCAYDSNSDSDSDYDSDYEDYWDGFTWDEEGDIYLDI